MKKYIVRINCSSFQDIEVEAESKEEAIDEAMLIFNCDGASPGFGEFIKK